MSVNLLIGEFLGRVGKISLLMREVRPSSLASTIRTTIFELDQATRALVRIAASGLTLEIEHVLTPAQYGLFLQTEEFERILNILVTVASVVNQQQIDVQQPNVLTTLVKEQLKIFGLQLKLSTLTNEEIFNSLSDQQVEDLCTTTAELRNPPFIDK